MLYYNKIKVIDSLRSLELCKSHLFLILFKFAAGVVIDEDRQDHFAVVTGGIGDVCSSQSVNYPEAIKLTSTEILIDDMWWFGEFG